MFGYIQWGVIWDKSITYIYKCNDRTGNLDDIMGYSVAGM